jgi:RNA polymerase sigma-70 factor (ECF subfamily)
LDDVDEVNALIGTVRIYVYRSGLAAGAQVDDVVREVLSEMIIEGLRAVDRFDPDRSARAWLLGIGTNVIKRHKDRTVRLNRELTISQLPLDEERDADEWIFDHVVQLRHTDVTAETNDDDAVRRLLAPLPEDDRKVVRLAILHEMNGVEIAHALGIRPGAARQRLHRALGRLRVIWGEHKEKGFEE